MFAFTKILTHQFEQFSWRISSFNLSFPFIINLVMKNIKALSGSVILSNPRIFCTQKIPQTFGIKIYAEMTSCEHI